MALHIDPEFLAEVHRNYLALYHKKPSLASSYLRQQSKNSGINVQTLHRHLKLGVRKPRKVDEKVIEKNRTIDSYGQLVWEFVRANTRDEHSPSITTAFRVLKDEGRLPPELTRTQIYAAIDRLNLRTIAQPVHKRFERDRPMALWQVDFSKSLYIKPCGDDEVKILHPNFTKRQSDGNSLWFGVAIDDCARVMYVQYYIAKGESAMSTQAFLVKAFEEKRDRKLLQGLPEAIYVDRGSPWLTQSTKNGLSKLGINQIVGADEVDSQGVSTRRSNKKARGKVERAIRTLKDKMEQEFLFKLGEGRTISLAQLNMMVESWTEKWNEEHHMTQRQDLKWSLYKPCLETISFPPPDSLSLFSQSNQRKVVQRMISVGNGVKCIAPFFLRDGDSVEVIKGNGGHYVYHKGNKYKLEYQVGTRLDQLTKVGIRLEDLERRELRSESDDEIIRDHYVNRRFAEELGMPLRELPAILWRDIEPFFDSDQTLADIKKLAAEVKARLHLILPSNVLRMPLQSNE